MATNNSLFKIKHGAEILGGNVDIATDAGSGKPRIINIGNTTDTIGQYTDVNINGDLVVKGTITASGISAEGNYKPALDNTYVLGDQSLRWLSVFTSSYLGHNINIKNSSFVDTFTVTGSTGNITTSGDLAINGGDITTTSLTFNIGTTQTGNTTTNINTINTSDTYTKTMNIGTGGATGSITNINIGSSTGTSSINAQGNLTISGNLTVNGTTSTLNSTTLQVDDINIELGTVTTPSDITANTGGITLKGATDKTLTWLSSNAAWNSSENFNLVTGKTYKINSVDILTSTTLGSSVVNSSLTSVGTIGTGTWNATTIATSKGGTGLTTFTSGGAVYATSTSALTTGTLPVTAGGTGVTTSTGSGNVVLSTSPTLVTPVLGTPSSGNLTNCTFPTLNQNTTGNAATATKLATIRSITLDGDVSGTADFDGSTNITITTTVANDSHTHSDSTQTVAGFMSTTDKIKLDGVEVSANNYSHPTGDGNLHVPATSTTNNGKFLTAGATAGSLSWTAPATKIANLIGAAWGLPYQSALDTTSFLTAGTAGYILKSGGPSAAPSWLQTLPVANGGTGTTSATQYALTYASSTSALASLSVGTAGQVLTSNASTSAPVWTDVTGTGNVVKDISPTILTPNITSIKNNAISKSITSWSYIGTAITINCTGHGLVTGDYTNITGLTATTFAPNGTHKITYVSTNSFTYIAPNTPTGTAGVSSAASVLSTTIETGLRGLMIQGPTKSVSIYEDSIYATSLNVRDINPYDEINLNIGTLQPSLTTNINTYAGTGTKILNLNTGNLAGGTVTTTIGSTAGTSSTLIKGTLDISDTLTVTGNTTLTGDLAVNGGDITTLSTALTIGQTSTATSTINIGNNATLSGSTKTMNIGTSGASGSLASINIGPVNSVANSTINLYGSINNGTWNATTIATGKGGTGLTSFTSGGAVYATSTSALTTGTLPVTAGGTGTATAATQYALTYASSTTALTSLPVGTAGYILKSGGTAAAPSWLQTLPATNGGTDQTTYAIGDILYASSTTALSRLADVAAGSVLISGGVSAAPLWGKVPLTTHVTGALPATNGGTGQTSYTVGDILYASSTTALSKLSAGTAGYVLQANGAGVAPSWAVASTNLDSLTDVVITTPSTNQLLTYNGTNWVNSTPGPSGATITNDNSTNVVQYLGMSRINTGAWTSAYTADTKLYFNPSSGTLNSTNFNSLSDENFKENIYTIPDSLNIIKSLNGVGFNWKDNGIKSYGVIAQELEKIIPELVSESNGVKSVNYDGIIGFLINAVKELSEKVELLEKK